MRRISRDFLRLSPKDVAVYGQVVEGKMTQESGLYPNPTPPIGTLATTREALEAAYTSAEDGGLVQRQERAALEDIYKQQLLQLSDYVAMHVSNDAALMERSGFTLTKIREKVGPMPAVTDLRISYPALSGEMILRWLSIYGAQTFIVQHKEVGTQDWTTTNCTRAKVKVSNLEPGKKYVFRVAAIGSEGQGPWSQEFQAMAL